MDRDSKRPELYRLGGSEYVFVQPDSESWLCCDTMGVRMRVIRETPPRLEIEDTSDAR